MYSSEFIKILVGRDIDNYVSEEKQTETKTENGGMFRFARLATVPDEVKVQNK